jgi:hypothetical protein
MIKKIALLLGGIILVVGLIGGGCSWTVFKTVQNLFSYQLSFDSLSYKTFGWCTNGLPFADKIKNLVNKNYYVVLQNNTELRATGGFMGSFAVLTTHCSQLNRNCGIKDIRFQDIYEPDGKLPGHVEPPYSIQEAFGQGWWKLRDANWDPDFASAAATIAWFLEQGREPPVGGIIAINQLTVVKLLKIFGPIKMVTYDEVVTANNFYNLAQKYAETRSVGNKTDKRGFLGAIGTSLIERIKGAKLSELIKLTKLIGEQLNDKQILVWMADKDIQEDVVRMRWDGGLKAGWNEVGDYVYVVDSNLGANKSDCCIERKLIQSVVKKDGLAKVSLKIIRKNNNPTEVPKPPVFWGGEYVDYVRVVIPKTAINIVSVTVGGKPLIKMTSGDFELPNSLRLGRSEDKYNVVEKNGFYEIGFWMVVKSGETEVGEVAWESRRGAADKYEFWLKRQPGIETFSYQLIVNNKIVVNKKVDKDMWYSVLLGE